MKRNSLNVALAAMYFFLMSIIPLQAASLLAFPGAEGFGRYAAGGRGGTIYHVTNLNDSGTGSFREAVSTANRIIVFDVSGIIYLESTLVFENNLTILGQTAPGEGIQVYGERVSFSGADDIIVRYMRIRMGIGGTSGKDAAGVANGQNMIFDHMSVLWGRDETFSISWDDKGTEPTNITIQNSIIGQGLQTHSCGGLMQTNGGVTLYRNLYIENKTRNPKVKGLNQYVNNVVYNWGNGGCYIMGGTTADSWAHIENNYFINGPWEGAADVFSSGTTTFTYFADGNYWDYDQDGVLDGTLMSSSYYSASTAISDFDTWDNSTTRPQAHPTINNMMTAQNALAWIIDSVGPSLPKRDEVDAYLIDEVTSYGTKGSTGGITTEKTLPHGGTGVLYGGYKPQDTDGDAIPDSWETVNGLDPNDASDAAELADNGYANIENYSFTINAPYPYIKSPSGVASTAITTSSISITWTDNSTDETGFYVEQSTDGITYTVVDTMPADSTSYMADGLPQVTTYYFRVRAFNDSLVSPYSAVFSTATYGDPAIPEACSDPTPSNGGTYGVANALKMTWSNTTTSFGGTLYYFVYLSTNPDSLVLVADSITTSYYTYGTVSADTTYYWRVDTRNTMGRTQGEVWSFETLEGGRLFYTDFYESPTAFYDKYGSITENTNLVNAANTSVTAGGITIGSGANSLRIVYMMTGVSSTVGADYGPYSAADSGATARAIQFYTASAGGYIKCPEVQGPCKITIWTANPAAASTTYKLNTIINSTESNVASFTMAAKKCIFKNEYTYLGTDKVIFKIDANGKKFNVNDIMIESFVPEVSEDPIAFTATPDTVGVSYMDGSMTFTFNQTINYNGGITINGDQYEQISTSGLATTSLTVSHIGLDANTEYTISFPEGSITDYYNTKSFSKEFTFTTCDYLAEKVSGDTHYGKAAATLPLDYKPFNVMAPFTTVGSLVQTTYADFPHWITATGGITADSVLLTSTNDKIMGYFNNRSQFLWLKAYYSGSGTINLKIQESRNPDGTPGWRTMRLLTNSDFPLDQNFYLNANVRFFKIVPTTLSSGTLIVQEVQLSDASGNGLSELSVELGVQAISGNGKLTFEGLSDGMDISIYDVTGRMAYRFSVHGETEEVSIPGGFYVVRVKEGNAVQLLKVIAF